MTVMVIVGAVWLLFVVLVVALCRAAAAADRESERHYDELVAQDPRRWADTRAGRQERAMADRFVPDRRTGRPDRRVAGRS